MLYDGVYPAAYKAFSSFIAAAHKFKKNDMIPKKEEFKRISALPIKNFKKSLQGQAAPRVGGHKTKIFKILKRVNRFYGFTVIPDVRKSVSESGVGGVVYSKKTGITKKYKRLSKINFSSVVSFSRRLQIFRKLFPSVRRLLKLRD